LPGTLHLFSFNYSCPDVSLQSGQLQDSAFYLFIIVNWMEKLAGEENMTTISHFQRS
jgi:hypothetical protein